MLTRSTWWWPVLLGVGLTLGCGTTTVVKKADAGTEGEGEGAAEGEGEGAAEGEGEGAAEGEGEGAAEGEGEGAAEGEGEGPAEGEGEGPAEGEGEGGNPDDGVWGSACDPDGAACPDAAYACMPVDHDAREGTCLRKCGPVTARTCEQADCPAGTACANIEYPKVRNLCLPGCLAGDRSACFVGTSACAPEIKSTWDGEVQILFHCENDDGSSRYVCLP